MIKYSLDKINCYILIISTILYFSQGVLYPAGKFLGLFFLFTILIISLIYFFKVLIKKDLFNGIGKVLTIFLLLNILYYILSANKETNLNLLKMVLLNFLPFFPFVYFAKQKILNRKALLTFFILSLPIFLVQVILSIYQLKFSFAKDEVVDNTAYILIGLLPFVFLFKNKLFTISSLLVIWYYMVQTSKRAAIVSGVLAIFLFLYQAIYASKYKYKIQTYFLAILLTIGISYFANKFYSENEFLSERMELMFSGDSTGRGELINIHYDKWASSNNTLIYIFGLGFNSLMMFSNIGAHNDWMDMLGSFGVFGLLIYIILWYYMIRELFVGKWNKDKKIIMILFLGISLIASLFFRWYNSPFPYMNYLILPYLIQTKSEEI